MVDQILCTLWSIVIKIFWIAYKTRIILNHVPIKTWWWFIMIPKYMLKNSSIIAKIISRRNMNIFKISFISPLFFFELVKTSEKHSIETKFSEKSCIVVRMSKRIDLPSNSRSFIKFFEYKIVTNFHIIYHIFIYWTSFIMHRPASIYKF